MDSNLTYSEYSHSNPSAFLVSNKILHKYFNIQFIQEISIPIPSFKIAFLPQSLRLIPFFSNPSTEPTVEV